MKDGDRIIQLARQRQRLNRLMPEVKTPIMECESDTAHYNDDRIEWLIDYYSNTRYINELWLHKQTHNN